MVDAATVGIGGLVSVGFAGPSVDSHGVKIRGAVVATQGRVLAVNDQHDLALVEVPAQTPPITWGDSIPQPAARPARLSTTPPREGTSIAVSGYPLDELSLVTNAGVLGSSFTLHDVGGGVREERHLGDFTANPGNSGGPVYIVGTAAVIGVCIAGRLAPVVGGAGAHAAGLTLIVPIAEVVTLMVQHGIDANTPAVPARPARGRKKRHRK